jgi:pantothenate kinase
MLMLSNNIAQIASLEVNLIYNLQANKWNATQTFFAGGFIRNNPIIWSKIDFGMEYWTNNKTKAMFVRHDGYLGAVGAFSFSS